MFYGSQTGTAEEFANRLSKDAHRYGMRGMAADPEEYDLVSSPHSRPFSWLLRASRSWTCVKGESATGTDADGPLLSLSRQPAGPRHAHGRLARPTLSLPSSALGGAGRGEGMQAREGGVAC